MIWRRRMISLTRMQAPINAQAGQGVASCSIGGVRSFSEGGAKKRERVRCIAIMTNGGGQGARMQQRRTLIALDGRAGAFPE